MCYSAMVEQSHRKLANRYRAAVDLDRYEDLFRRRCEGEKLTIPRGMEAAFTIKPQGQQEQLIATLIQAWHADQVTLREAELVKQRGRLADAERRLKKRETKTAANDKRIASQKIPWLEDKIHWHQLTRPKEADSRIFPQHYVSMVYADTDGKLVVGPFRYHLRPAWANEKWDDERPNSYNARRDSLTTVWKNQFGKKHGVLLVKCFWENVAPNDYKAKPKLAADLRTKDNIIIQFEPDDSDYMAVPTIYDVWERQGKATLYGTALITDDPLEEVALAGHNRTPISLTPIAAGQWLHPGDMDDEQLLALLDDIKRPFYDHAVAA